MFAKKKEMKTVAREKKIIQFTAIISRVVGVFDMKRCNCENPQRSTFMYILSLDKISPTTQNHIQQTI